MQQTCTLLYIRSETKLSTNSNHFLVRERHVWQHVFCVKGYIPKELTVTYLFIKVVMRHLKGRLGDCSPFWNEILPLFCTISLTSCFPPQQQSTQWVSQRYRSLSGLVFIYSFICLFISKYLLFIDLSTIPCFVSDLDYFLFLVPLFLTLMNIYLAFFSCYLGWL